MQLHRRASSRCLAVLPRATHQGQDVGGGIADTAANISRRALLVGFGSTCAGVALSSPSVAVAADGAPAVGPPVSTADCIVQNLPSMRDLGLCKMQEGVATLISTLNAEGLTSQERLVRGSGHGIVDVLQNGPADCRRL